MLVVLLRGFELASNCSRFAGKALTRPVGIGISLMILHSLHMCLLSTEFILICLVVHKVLHINELELKFC